MTSFLLFSNLLFFWKLNTIYNYFISFFEFEIYILIWPCVITFWYYFLFFVDLDSPSEDMISVIGEAKKFIERVEDINGRVLVHCIAGKRAVSSCFYSPSFLFLSLSLSISYSLCLSLSLSTSLSFSLSCTLFHLFLSICLCHSNSLSFFHPLFVSLGASRSVTIVILYFMLKHRFPLKTIYNYILSCRWWVLQHKIQNNDCNRSGCTYRDK